MNRDAESRAERIRSVVGAVARQALRDRGHDRVAVLDDDSPEAELAAGWLALELGRQRVVRVRVEEREVDSLLQILNDASAGPLPQTPGRGEGWPSVAGGLRRLVAAVSYGDALVANPSNKTALLLDGPLPPEPFLPLGDLYASEVAELAGAWSAGEAVRAMAVECGGIERLDGALRQRIDRRDPRGLHSLGSRRAAEVEAVLARGRAARVFPMVVPKIGGRTIGTDLFE